MALIVMGALIVGFIIAIALASLGERSMEDLAEDARIRDAWEQKEFERRLAIAQNRKKEGP